MAHIYEVGTRAWQPDPTEGWLASEVKEKLEDGEKVQLIFELENGEVGALEPWVLDALSCLLFYWGWPTDTGLIGADKNRGDHAVRAAGR